MKKNLSLLCLVAMLFEVHTAFAGDVKTEKVTLVGKRIVEFVPEGYDASQTPSLTGEDWRSTAELDLDTTIYIS